MLTVLERELVVVVSSFEAVFCHANINLCFAGCGSDSCFVDDVVDKACTVKRDTAAKCTAHALYFYFLSMLPY